MARNPDRNPVARSVKGLQAEQRLAGIAAIALALTLVLPWYDKSAVLPGKDRFASDSLNAFQVFSWVEAAVLLISVSVLVLLYQRSQGRAFHLPFGDGTVILAAGAWTMFLLGWRFFDKPGVAGEGSGATIGINWGIFFALAAAAGVAVAGYRLRAARVPEPPLPGEDYGWVESPRRRDRDRERERERERPREPRTTRVRPNLAPTERLPEREERTAVTEPLPPRRRSGTEALGGPPPPWEEGELPPGPERAAPPPVPPATPAAQPQPPPPADAQPAPLPPPAESERSDRLF